MSLLCLHAQPRPAVSWKKGVSASTVSFLPDWLYGPLLCSRRLQSPPLFLSVGGGREVIKKSQLQKTSTCFFSPILRQIGEKHTGKMLKI